jgi:hypothetical protein
MFLSHQVGKEPFCPNAYPMWLECYTDFVVSVEYTALESRFGGADCHSCTWLGLTLSWYCAAMYDDRSVRSHVRRARDLISTASVHSSLSTALASEYEAKQADATGEPPLLIPLQFLPNS